MQPIWNTVLKGLAAILPVGLTLYIVIWFAVSLERFLRAAMLEILPERHYWPGMGLVAGLLLLFTIGLAVNAWIVRHLFGGALLERIPLVKSVYGALRDFAEYFVAARGRKDLRKVVVVSFGGARLIGFLTREQVDDLPASAGLDDLVAVYLPMSYQIGGYTVLLPRANVAPIDMSAEYALRFVLTAGLAKLEAASR